MNRLVWGWSAAVVAALLLWPAAAGAHAMPASAILLDVGATRVSGHLELPLGRLAFALDRPIDAASALGVQRAYLENYVSSHIRATGADGATWTVTVGNARVARINGVQDLVLSLKLTPPSGRVSNFDLRYSVIIDRLATHRALAIIRTEWSKGTFAHRPQALGIFDWNTSTLRVNTAGGSWWRGFGAAIRLGVNHIATGADHLLFLLMLLVPAPLVARRRRWSAANDTRRSVIRVIHVVSAFAIGHSITLALATFGVVHAPSRLVESLIAVSIMVSALHALRPLIPGGEALIAAGFGLVHGLAFATLLGDLGLTGRSLVSLLFGFNLGIELTQLFVVALIMPSLCILARTPVYPATRIAMALLGLVLSASWLLNRSGILPSDPFAGLESAAIAHPLEIAAGLALIAVGARSVSQAAAGRRLTRAPDALPRKAMLDARPSDV